MTRLLLDAGNSRLKWALVNAPGQDPPRGVVTPDAEGLEGLARSLSPHESPESIHVISVRDEGFFDGLSSFCAHQGWPVPLLHQAVQEAHGIRNAYADPGRLGADRYAAMVGARRLFAGSLVVIDCGTALTLDAVDPDGRHLGGMILPGLRLMALALGQGTAQIGVKPDGPPALLADNTAGAVSGGALFGMAAAVDGLCERIESNLTEPFRRILCGGDAPRILPWLKGRYELCPWLVLQGLDVMTGGRACEPWS
ncbi:type III pantothenate kinase [Thioalkalivibrio sulfidiphilus]|uniref:type III pantothenate kinase n=1 Tax=Thioalkalivibrio sulfidiphilus TaxID=1033854 RepID=UPI00037EFB48|nr:type III pantothenate kinase [Thioalkalivibrio sulfidiphilus]